MHHPSPDHCTGQSWRANHRRMRTAPKSEVAARLRSAALQKQHRLCRAQLRLPRQLPDEPRHRVGPYRRRDSAVSRHSPDFRRRRQDGRGSGEQPERAWHLSNLATRRFFQRGGEHRHDESPPFDQHARRAACRCQPLPPVSRDPWRFEHERMGHSDEDRDHVARSGFDRARGSATARDSATGGRQQVNQPRSNLRLDHRTDGWPQNLCHRCSANLSACRQQAAPRRAGRHDLERDPMAARDRIDWAAKKFLLDTLQEEEKLSWSDPWLQSIDLEYHNLDLDRGLYYELVRKGLMRRITTEDEIKTAIFNPPETTRAFFRGRAVARFNDEISSIQWDEIVFTSGAYSRRIPLPEAATDARLDALNHAARNGKDFSQFMNAIAQIG
ncbi:MAG: hypothetical protein DME76_04955 [Verrucomicrobia bacterium]|nr:MAG: hypothetical protein DME76_04955 [Verrucomicrobiota bacterium]